ncbi:MAG: lipid-binding SYLF domain-containing protein [Alphaproteobacteria bacterium]|nr:lipid-binding SYLF domain-containing protein [Alphaproteobacteria bacterium]MCL2505010.1 lipid-binding SYLF domain-containing protein [Alphaproteobacteria bacterium]
MENGKLKNKFLFAVVLITAALSLSACQSGDFNQSPGTDNAYVVKGSNDAERLVSRSTYTFKSMMGSGDYPALVMLAARARAIIIFPNMIRGGFIVGARGGNGVMLVRDDRKGWSEPAFYTFSGLNFGLQAGGQLSELVITVMSDKGVNAIMDRSMTFGGEAGVTFLDMSNMFQASTGLDTKADFYVFSRSEGLFGGLSLDGSGFVPIDKLNKQLYGIGANQKSILIHRTSGSDSKIVRELVEAMP